MDPDELRARWAAFDQWRADLVAELRMLPQTLKEFREGVSNFKAVSGRLAASTEGIERLNEVYASSVGATMQRMSDAAAAVQHQLDPLRNRADPDVRKAVEDLTHNLAALAELNPFWPKRGGGQGSTKR